MTDFTQKARECLQRKFGMTILLPERSHRSHEIRLSFSEPELLDAIAVALSQLETETREKCAKIAENFGNEPGCTNYDCGGGAWWNEIAAAIRKEQA